MERCATHDLINCRCREPLATFLVRQFAESQSDGVVRNSTWVAGDHFGNRDRWGARPDRIGRHGEAGGDR